MENVSKALLIAGAILISILIISAGILVYNNSVGTIAGETSDMSNQMILMSYNNEYQLYEGVQYGSSVKLLLQKASTNNQELYLTTNIEDCVCIRSNCTEILDYFKNESDMTVALNGTRSYGVRYPSNILRISSVIKTNSKYKIEFDYNSSGRIWEININSI